MACAYMREASISEKEISCVKTFNLLMRFINRLHSQVKAQKVALVGAGARQGLVMWMKSRSYPSVGGKRCSCLLIVIKQKIMSPFYTLEICACGATTQPPNHSKPPRLCGMGQPWPTPKKLFACCLVSVDVCCVVAPMAHGFVGWLTGAKQTPVSQTHKTNGRQDNERARYDSTTRHMAH